MDIKYLGHASFLLRGRTGKVVTDPFDPSTVGLKFPKVEADIVTISHDHADHSASNRVSGEPLVITLPGEYEKKGIRITGFHTYHDAKGGAQRGNNTIYMIEIDDIRVLHLGDLGHTLDEELLEAIDGVDVLLVPVGGHYTIGPEHAAKLTATIEASLVIPMHFRTKGLAEKLADKLAPVSEFLSQLDAAVDEPVTKLSIKKSDLTQEETKVVVMRPA